jgi:hypothetical protein
MCDARSGVREGPVRPNRPELRSCGQLGRLQRRYDLVVNFDAGLAAGEQEDLTALPSVDDGWSCSVYAP